MLHQSDEHGREQRKHIRLQQRHKDLQPHDAPDQRSRSDAAEANRLTLRRDLWLDFDGGVLDAAAGLPIAVDAGGIVVHLHDPQATVGAPVEGDRIDDQRLGCDEIDLHSRAADITAATMLAQEKLIEAELLPDYPVGETTGDFRNPPPGYQVPGDIAERAERYRWKRIITTTPLTAVREVKIQILWQQGATDEVLETSTYVFVFAPTTGF